MLNPSIGKVKPRNCHPPARVYAQENDTRDFANLMKFPIIPCNLYGSQENLARVKTKKLIHTLVKDDPKISSNMFHALQSIKPSQLMDKSLWDFFSLEEKRGQAAEDSSLDIAERIVQFYKEKPSDILLLSEPSE